jgi:hypothetical protein
MKVDRWLRMPDGKVCLGCGTFKLFSEYKTSPSGKFGYHGRCKLCQREKAREYTRAARQRPEVRARRTEKENAARRQQRKDDPDFFKNKRLKHMYGVSLADFNARLEHQDGICAVEGCERPATHVDHDHSCCAGYKGGCGQCFRGILCPACNTALSRVGDSIERLEALIIYLREYQHRRKLGRPFSLDKPLRRCERCFVGIDRGRKNARYCSKYCQQTAWKEAHPEHRDRERTRVKVEYDVAS